MAEGVLLHRLYQQVITISPHLQISISNLRPEEEEEELTILLVATNLHPVHLLLSIHSTPSRALLQAVVTAQEGVDILIRIRRAPDKESAAVLSSELAETL